LKRFFAVLVFVCLVAGTLTYHSFYEFLNPPPPLQPRTVIVRIQSGMGLHQIAHLLEREGLISEPNKFMLLAWLKGVGKKIQWGYFELSAGLPPGRILDTLTSGRNLLRKVTIPEGFTLQQIAERLEVEEIVSGDEFLALARDRDWVSELGVENDTLEGYLFPDTYFFNRGMPARPIQKRMVKRFEEVYLRCRGTAPRRAPLDLNKSQIVTLASIVEKESGLQAERPLIASVFYNRLQKGIPLQSDPTVIYGLRFFNGDLTRKHLETPTPYNTYTRSGLPPGPIANPGEDSLRAVLNPAQSDYYYFVSRKDGSHYFSRNIQEHNRAVFRYQLSGVRRPPAGEQKRP
jgi:UPF0755 protein